MPEPRVPGRRMPEQQQVPARLSRAGTSSTARWPVLRSLWPAWLLASLPGGDDMRAFTAAAIQIAPVPGPLSPDVVNANIEKCVDWLTRCVRETGAELVVLPESATTGFTPCLLYTSDAADDLTRVDLGGRRILKNK